MDELPPWVDAADAVDEDAERVVSALAVIFRAPPWRPGNDRQAEFVMAKLARATAEIAEAEELAAEYRARIDDWLASRTARARGTAAWAEAVLVRYLEALHAADPKVLSRKLPSGAIRSTAGRLEWVVSDPDAVLKAAGDDPDLAELVVPASVAGPQTLAKVLTPREAEGDALTADGTIVPGIVVRRRPRTYRASPA